MAVHDFKRVPTASPPFTVGSLRKAIPAHCWERSLLTSLKYLFCDLAMAAGLYYFSTLIPSAPAALRYALWPAYWWLQGVVCTGLWVIAHECGHQAFSKYQAVNDGVGLVVHSCLLVPYYSWKHSHRRHHSNTGNVMKDEVFVPPSKPIDEPEPEFSWEDFWPARFVWLFLTLTVGWPLYLCINATGRPYNHWPVNHFDPYSPIFSKRERVEVFVSDLALLLVTSGLYKLGTTFGWTWLLCTYGIPYLVVNHFLNWMCTPAMTMTCQQVMITLLQHTHKSLPHYDDKEWDWLRGALCTVDRSFGPFLNVMHHHIADTHVSHHLFSQMPHYHAQEATAALKPVLGDYYKFDSREVYSAMWHDWRACRFVSPAEHSSGVLWYRK